jgi:hypothetical protein
MSSTSPTTIERAFELARSGNHRSIEDIRRQLTREGHSGIYGHLSGSLIRKQLARLIASSNLQARD